MLWKVNNFFQLNTRYDMTTHEEVVHSRHVRILLPLFFLHRRENREKAILQWPWLGLGLLTDEAATEFNPLQREKLC